MNEEQKRIAHRITFGRVMRNLHTTEEYITIFYNGDCVGYINRVYETDFYSFCFAKECEDNLHITTPAAQICKPWLRPRLITKLYRRRKPPCEKYLQ